MHGDPKTLNEVIPDVTVLLSLPPEEIAPILLRLARRHLRNGRFNPNNLTTVTVGVGMMATDEYCYPADRQSAIERVVSEA